MARVGQCLRNPISHLEMSIYSGLPVSSGITPETQEWQSENRRELGDPIHTSPLRVQKAGPDISMRIMRHF